MSLRLTPAAIVLLVIPPLMWSCNAVLGRMLSPHISPMTLNLMRWILAFLILLPIGWRVLTAGSGLWGSWRRFAWLSLFSVGAYNALLYLALNTSTAINVTLVGASTPVWMLLIGRFMFGEPVTPRQLLGAALSIAGVATVLGRGQLDVLLHLQLVPGDFYVILASMSWAFYSWMLVHPTTEPPAIKSRWAEFLLAQVFFGLAWSGLFAAGEWTLTPAHIDWSWPLAAALVFIAAGPAVIAYASWGAGVARAGPTAAGFFINLTPLFAAVLSTALLGETPKIYHAIAFVLIVSGILLSSNRRKH